MDGAFSGSRAQVSVAIKGGSEYARILDAYLFPRGVSPVTELKARPQLEAYQAWLLLVAHAAATVAVQPADRLSL